MLTVLGGLAELKHELIQTCTTKGREHAGEPIREAARTFNFSHGMISRLSAYG